MGRFLSGRTFLILLAVCGAFLGAAPGGAQTTGQVTGVVRAAKTERPIGNAQVFLRGTRMGALTGQDGRYLILNVPAGRYEVRVEIIGYAAAATTTVNVTAGATAVADFSLGETAVALEEIVVTGTAAEVRAREIGNALDAVSMRDIRSVPVTNPENILSGRIPGLTVMQGGGQPGAGNTVRIRGQLTASSTQDPLIYVDGVRIFSDQVGTQGGARTVISPLQDIPAEDIERIEVIKGASAATLYGTEAAGGVIQIFTKRGMAGAPIWNAEFSTGFNNQGRVGPEGDTWQLFTQCGDEMYGLNMSASAANYGKRVPFVDPTCPSSGSWFRNGALQRYNVSVRGGMGDVTYFVSGNYADEEGTLPTQEAKTGGVRANLDFKPTRNLKFSVNTAYATRNLSFVEDGNSASGFLLNVGRGNSGNFKGGKGDDCAEVATGVTCISNKYIFDTDNLTNTDRFTGGITMQYDVTESFTNRIAVGYDYNTVHSEWTRPWGGLRVPLGQYNDALTRHTKLSIDYAGSWRRALGSDLQSTFSWGGQLFKDHHRWMEVYTENFAGPGVPSLESGSVWDPPADAPFSETNAGAFVQELLGYKDLLFFTGGLRIDGNSTFGDDFGLEAYPKASVAYVLSDYGFWPQQTIETFKLRGAFGYSGKAPGAFDKLRTWSPVSGDEGSPGFTPGNVGNAALGPERTREIEVGFDLSALQGRAGVEATYFNAVTTDALVGVTLPPSNGFLQSRVQNAGELKSDGWEFQLTAVPLRTDWLEWRLRSNLSFLASEAVDLNCRTEPDSGERICSNIAAGNLAEIRVGEAVPTNFTYRVTNPNEIADPILSDTLEAIGPVFPTKLLGFSTQVALFNRITLDALVEFQGGHYLPNYTGYQNARRGVWPECYPYQEALGAFKAGDASALDAFTALERGRCATNAYGGHDSSYWLEKADFWKLRSVSVTYDLPQALVSRFGSRASVSLSGRNLATWTDFRGTDPEVEDSNDRMGQLSEGVGEYGRREYYNLPPSRTFLLTMRVTF